MQQVTLLTKPGCHLCEKAEELLVKLAAEYPHTVTRVDIQDDTGLLAAYGERIPVIQVGDTEIAAPISEFRLRRALARGVPGNAQVGGSCSPRTIDIGSGPPDNGERTI